MKCFILIISFIAALSLASFGQAGASLSLQISNKEKQLAKIQKELHELRSKLSAINVEKYTVKQGDTLHSIARSNGVSVSSIIEWNKITEPEKLKVGEAIIVSELPSPPISTTPRNIRSFSSEKSADYVIARGDTFYSIARLNKMNLSELRALNPNVNIHLLSPGKKLRISGNLPATSLRPKRQEVLIVEDAEKPQINNSTLKPPVPKEISKSTASSTIETTNSPAPGYPSNLPQPPIVGARENSSKTKSIILTDVITFEAFASRHGTNTKLLNALNGWNLPKTTILAGGSEILVPN
jgi:LysM repeat protein